MGKTKTLPKKPREPNSFEKLVTDKNTQKIKKVKKSKAIVDTQMKANLGNKMKIKHEANQPIEQGKKKSLFRLDSEDEEEQQDLRNWKLKHKGRELKQDDDFRENIIASSSSDEQIGKDIVKNYHFTGFEGDSKKKTRAEIYQDIIVNSKQRKAEKTRQKEENQAKIEELNNVFPLISDFLPKYIPPKKNPQGDDYFNLAQMFSKEQKVIASYVPSTNQQVEKKREKAKERRQRQIEEIEKTSSSEEMNDDNQPVKLQSEKERKMLKPLKKVQNMQKMMENIRQVQDKSNPKKEQDELDELSESESGDEEGDEDEQEGDEQEGDEEDGDEEEGDEEEGDQEEGDEEEGDQEEGDEEEGDEEDVEGDDDELDEDNQD